MDDLIGRTLKGRFRITAQQGEGSMGTVYRGIDSSTGDEVAIKVMRRDLMTEPAMLARFRREANAMRRVQHRSAVKVLSHGVDAGIVFVAMELVAGVNLADMLLVQGPLEPERAARIMIDICDALADAHARGVIHRDIKPSNIMLAGPRSQAVKLIDFGFAKSRGPLTDRSPDDSSARDSLGSIPDDLEFPEEEEELTSAGVIVGSPGYMAPEQWAGGAVDARTDVYACGVVLYELVTGRLPFVAANTFLLPMLQRDEAPDPPHFLNPSVPESLAAVILRALLPSPAARYQSAAQMRDALEAVLRDAALSSGSLEATVPFLVPSVLRADGLLALDRTALLDDRPSEPIMRSDSLLSFDRPCLVPDGWGDTLALDATQDQGPIRAITAAYEQAEERATIAPIDARRAAVLAQARLLIPLTAAFLALGVILGFLLFLPGPR